MKEPAKKDLEALSAFLDGDESARDRAEALLRDYPEWAARHRQWSKMSNAMRTMPEAEVSPAFRTRTMAAIREIEPAPRRAWWRPPAWMSGVAVATCALFIAAAWLYTRNDPAETQVAGNTFADTETIEIELIDRLDDSPGYLTELSVEFGVDESNVFDVDTEEVETSEEVDEDGAHLFDLLASVESAVTDDKSLDYMVTHMDSSTEAALREMMMDWADEELYL